MERERALFCTSALCRCQPNFRMYVTMLKKASQWYSKASYQLSARVLRTAMTKCGPILSKYMGSAPSAEKVPNSQCLKTTQKVSFRHTGAKINFLSRSYQEFDVWKMWILWKMRLWKFWILWKIGLWKMRFWKCEFCTKYDFEIVNFVKTGIFKMWFFGLIEDFFPGVHLTTRLLDALVLQS